MKKFTIDVPAGIRYLTDWSNLDGGYSLNNYQFPHILNKQITGCGFTEYCLRAKGLNVVVCSPRRILLENKFDQHRDSVNVFYFKNTLEKSTKYDKDIQKVKSTNDPNSLKSEEPAQPTVEVLDTKKPSDKPIDALNELKRSISENVDNLLGIGCKILVTYDSFRHVKDLLKELNLLNQFHIVVDEFQSIFIDSRFKSDTEIELLNQLSDLKKVCFVSATPMIEKYLDLLDEFKNLPYYELDWASLEPGRVIQPEISPKQCRNLMTEINRIIDEYRSGRFEKYSRLNSDTGKIEEVISKEAVIYVNSVRNICDIIKKNKLTPEETNVLCSKTSENENKVKEAFKKSCKQDGCIGTVPTKGQPHKMFTLCTRTVYVGADFYSTNARTFIFSDANIDSLSVDITLDLPQILGRQRLDENPWKNRAELYYKTVSDSNIIGAEFYNNYICSKAEKTKSLIRTWETTTSGEDKHNLAEAFLGLVNYDNYKLNYVSINKHAGSDLVPVFNNLVMVSEIRSFEIQQVEYRDRVSVLSKVTSNNIKIKDTELNSKVKEVLSATTFIDKMRLICTTGFDKDSQTRLLKQLPIVFESYYNVLGPERIAELSYRRDTVKAEYDKLVNNQEVESPAKERIAESFSVGSKYSNSYIKTKLKDIYADIGLKKTAKAKDLEDYFETTSCNVQRADDPTKYDKGYLIISLKPPVK